MPTFTYDIGYYGKVKVGGKFVLATGGGISVQQTPIFTSGVWGAGYQNAITKVAFAPDYPVLTANVDFQLTDQGVFSTLGDFITKRWIPLQVQILPNGKAGYTGESYCQSLSYSASADSLVTGSFSSKASKLHSESIKDDNKNDLSQQAIINSISPTYNNVFPYYGTKVTVGDNAFSIGENKIRVDSDFGMFTEIIGWNLEQTSQVIFSKCCSNFKGQMSDLYAQYAAFGMMEASGGFQTILLKSFKNTDQFRYHFQDFKIQMVSCKNRKVSIKCPGGIIFNSQSTSVQNGTDIISSDFSFTVVGDGQGDFILYQQE